MAMFFRRLARWGAVVLLCATAQVCAQTNPFSGPPVITFQSPDRVAGFRGSALTAERGEPALYGYANGALPMSAEWFRDGISLGTFQAGGAGPTYFEIRSLRPSDAGTYHFVLRNSLGTAQSRPTVVTVLEPLVITMQPNSVFTTAGATVALYVAATGEGPIAYRWMRINGGELEFAGSTENTLTVSVPESQIQSLNYYVEVSNAHQKVLSQEAHIVLGRPPVITRQPPSVFRMAAGLAQTIDVEYEGTAAAVEWRKNGVLQPDRTSTTLTIDNAANQTADYTITLRNLFGSVTSQTCRVIAAPALRVRTPAFLTSPAGSSMDIASTVDGGYPPYTFQWYRGYTAEAPIVGATSDRLRIPSLHPDHAGVFQVIVTDTAGYSATSEMMTVSVTPGVIPATTPYFVVEPQASRLGSESVGSVARFECLAIGATHYTWRRNGVLIAGANGPHLIVGPLSFADTGDYFVEAHNLMGSVSSRPARLTVVPWPRLMSTQPAAVVAVVAGTHARLSSDARGANPISYQWLRNGVPLAGATQRMLTVYNSTAADAGSYVVEARSDVGMVTAAPQTLTVAAPAARLTNVSVRTFAGEGSEALIAGYAVAGESRKSLLIRGIGPTLEEFGVEGVLRDPELTITDGGGRIVGSAGPHGGAPNLAAAYDRSGAFPLRIGTSDSAMVFDAAAGSYTARVGSRTGGQGIALAEIYDLDPGTSRARVANISARAYVDSRTGPLIVGFAIAGEGPLNVLVRVVGPGLRQFGADNTMRSPNLELHGSLDGLTRLLATNSGWGGSPIIADAAAKLGAFGLPAGSSDAAVLGALSPGTYTAIAQSREGGGGSVLVEVYVFQ